MEWAIRLRIGLECFSMTSLIIGSLACTTTKSPKLFHDGVTPPKKALAPVKKELPFEASQTSPDHPGAPEVRELVGPPKPERDPNCVVLSKMPHEPPVYAVGQGVVITRMMEACVAMDGRRGYTKKTPWLAMGFPCSGGSGRIEIKGNYQNPKLVSFIIGTDCGMAPQGQDAVRRAAMSAFDMPPEAKLMAYTPFVVQYWEIPGLSDADIGYAVELRSAPALESIWKKVRDNQVFRVKLFGRENTWAPGGYFYQVEADMRLTGRNAFQLTIVSVKHLMGDELMQVSRRCESLKPERNCAAVF